MLVLLSCKRDHYCLSIAFTPVGDGLFAMAGRGMKTRYWRSFPLLAITIVTTLLPAWLVHSYFWHLMVGLGAQAQSSTIPSTNAWKKSPFGYFKSSNPRGSCLDYHHTSKSHNIWTIVSNKKSPLLVPSRASYQA